MKKHISITRPLALILVLALLALRESSAYAAQHSDPPPTEIGEAARAKITAGGSLDEKVARAQARSEDVEAMAGGRAATFARSVAGQSAAQFRGRLRRNAHVANAGCKACADLSITPPTKLPPHFKPSEH